MRFILLTAVTLALIAGGCRGDDASQANNASTNISASASPPATAAASVVTPAAAATIPRAQAAQVMHQRHEGMEAIGKANKAIRRELEGPSPDLAAVRRAAAQIAQLAGKSAGWFPAGTGPDVGKTGAKPAIWQHPQDFAAKRGAFDKSAQAFSAAASGSDVGAIKASFANLGKSCKACHDSYRAEMKH